MAGAGHGLGGAGFCGTEVCPHGLAGGVVAGGHGLAGGLAGGLGGIVGGVVAGGQVFAGWLVVTVGACPES